MPVLPRQILLGLVACSVFMSGCAGDDSIAALSLNSEALAPELPRYGLNLGGSGTWGAEQLRANVLANPGFEPIVDRAIVVVGQAGGRRFYDDTDWLARPEGFWSGAAYDVRSGAAAGQQGKILDSSRRPGNGPAEFSTDTVLEALRPGDVVSLTRQTDATIAPHWWKGKGRVALSRDVPPGSRGQQSLRLLAMPGQTAEILHYLDSIGDRAGKLLPVNGKWKVGFWARQPGVDASLKIRFDRSGKSLFLEAEVSPQSQWKRYEFEFDASDTGPTGGLTFGFTARNGEVLIDEVYLGEADPGPGGFRRAVLDTLRSLKPGYLRDWQGQLGDTLENRLSDELAHRPMRYRPGDSETQFHYSLPDFLTLCAAVDAQPWVTAPTTLSDDEWRKLGRYLREAGDRYGFSEILVEFGNENWNTIFRPGGIPNPASLGQVADRGFRLLREGADNDPRLHTVINAQFVNPDSPRQVGAHSREVDRISVAPYFMYRLDAGTPVNAALAAAFKEDRTLLAKEAAAAAAQGKRLSVYEVNFHTTGGSAGPEQRNQITTSAASGAALARRLLQASLSGVREQAVYSFAGFDSFVDGSKALVRLWGITRDLSFANRLRPTGIALAMLNRVAGGRPHALECSGTPCALLTSLGFAAGKRTAIVSASAEPVPVRLALDCPAGARYTLRLLDGSDPLRNNETQTQVAIGEQNVSCRNNRLSFTIPPYSLVTLEPAGAS